MTCTVSSAIPNGPRVPCKNDRLRNMGDDFEHPAAVMYDAAGKRCTLKPRHLTNPEVYAEAVRASKARRLFELGEQFNLSVSPRTAERRAHFFAPCGSRNTSIYLQRDSSVHDDHVENLHAWLDGRRSLSLAGHDVCLDEYQWDKEVVRVLSSSVTVRHDLFGHSGVHMSKRRPWIAIEVIDTHYPDEPVFEELLRLTKELPLIVLFDVVECSNTFWDFDETQHLLDVRYTMRGGSVWWKNIQQKTVLTSAQLKQKMQGTRAWHASAR